MIACLAACTDSGGADGSPTTTAQSEAQSESPQTSATAPDGVDTSLLQPGNYPTAPREERPWSVEGAIRMQAQQMADYMVGAWEVDPGLTALYGTSVITDAADLDEVLLETGEVSARHGFINAFTSTRADPDPAGRRLVTMVMRFPTPEAAAAASSETSAALESYVKAGEQEIAFVPGHPETQATQSPQVGGKYQVTGLTARGPFVLYQEASSPENAEAAAALVGKMLDLQIPRIDEYKPTDPAQPQSLDPTGLVARTIPDPDTDNVGVYGAYGALHFAANPVATAERYTAAGVDAQANGAGAVIQAEDEAAATELARKTYDANAADQEPGPEVPGLPTAKCMRDPDPETKVRFRCVAPMGRWVVLTAGMQEANVTQQVAAQYLLLVGK